MCLSWRSDLWLRRYCLFSGRPSPKLVCTNSLGIEGFNGCVYGKFCTKSLNNHTERTTWFNYLMLHHQAAVGRLQNTLSPRAEGPKRKIQQCHFFEERACVSPLGAHRERSVLCSLRHWRIEPFWSIRQVSLSVTERVNGCRLFVSLLSILLDQ